MDFVPTQPWRQSKGSFLSQDTLFWKSFKANPTYIKEYAPIVGLHFSKERPYRFVVTSGLKVQVYNPRTRSIQKTVSRFKDTARSAQLRSDGKLIAAGDDSGLIQLFDVQSRAVLRTLTGHTQPVHAIRFSDTDTARLVSGSDDTIVKLWDIPTQTCVHEFTGHTDYVRSAAMGQDPNLFMTASYDSTMRLWDARTGQGVMKMKHGGIPIEDCLMFPSGGMAASAGGPIVRLFDLIAGGRCVKAISNHQKTITKISLDQKAQRLLSAGLDHMIKIYEVGSYRVLHTIKYSAPIMSFALSPDSMHLVAGMSDGTISIRSRVKAEQEEEEVPQSLEQVLASGQGQAVVYREQEFKIETQRRKHLKDYDRQLKSFNYAAALDMVLKKHVRPNITCSLLVELRHRNGLVKAIQDRDDIGLEPLVSFLVKYITDARFTSLICYVAQVVLGGWTHCTWLTRYLLTTFWSVSTHRCAIEKIAGQG